jgi:transcriptional regulator with XRE-family HTH domain
MLELTQHIAATLQLLRKQRSWSLDKAAQATGVESIPALMVHLYRCAL